MEKLYKKLNVKIYEKNLMEKLFIKKYGIILMYTVK